MFFALFSYLVLFQCNLLRPSIGILTENATRYAKPKEYHYGAIPQTWEYAGEVKLGNRVLHGLFICYSPLSIAPFFRLSMSIFRNFFFANAHSHLPKQPLFFQSKTKIIAFSSFSSFSLSFLLSFRRQRPFRRHRHQPSHRWRRRCLPCENHCGDSSG